MPTGNQKFDAAANEAGCAFLLAAGSGATNVAVYSLLTGQLVVGAGAALAAGVAAYAYATGCQWDPNQDPTNPGVNCNTNWKLTTPGDAYIYPVGTSPPSLPQLNNVQEIVASYPISDTEWAIEYVSAGDGQTYTRTQGYAGYVAVCVDLRGAGTPVTPSPDTPPTIPDYTYTDPDDGCQINVIFGGLGMGSDGSVSPVWEMEPILPPAVKSTGGIIGGCNFAPIVYYTGPGGGGGGGTIIPRPPGGPGPGGKPPWVDPLIAALAGAAGNLVADLLTNMFPQQIDPYLYTFRAACNYKQDGTPETLSINFPAQTYSSRVLALLEAQNDFLQQHLLWKTPTCSGHSSGVSGDAVSINWVSDEYSPVGNDRIRKLLTYFDQNNTTLEDTVTHWKDFTWNAGPVIVSCVGTPLGRPQVWADSVDEAKRVIEHAANIAGVDLANAEWQVAPPKSSRYGMTGVMRVATGKSGQLSITKRDGPSGLPEVLTPIPTPGSG